MPIILADATFFGTLCAIDPRPASLNTSQTVGVFKLSRGRLGGGITLTRLPQSLEPVLKRVIAELRASSPGRKIEAGFDLTQQVDCNGGRIGQLDELHVSDAASMKSRSARSGWPEGTTPFGSFGHLTP